MSHATADSLMSVFGFTQSGKKKKIRVTLEQRQEASKFVKHLIYERGLRRKWIAERMNTDPQFVTMAAAMSKRSDDKNRYYCPHNVILGLLEWKESEK